jgi:hypothetical protein
MDVDRITKVNCYVDPDNGIRNAQLKDELISEARTSNSGWLYHEGQKKDTR